MNSSKKIHDSLIKNSKDENVAEFLKAIFIKENQGLSRWNDVYDELIEQYSEVDYDEDWRDPIQKFQKICGYKY